MAAPRLKVYQAELGFYDTVVAAPNQKAALAAWGVRQNLFAQGEARVTEDAAAVAAALEHPQTPLKRPLGSADPFTLEPGLPSVPDRPRKAKAKGEAGGKTAPRAPAKPAPPDRSRLAAAEKALARLEDRHARDEAAFEAEADDLARRRAKARAEHSAARKTARAKLAQARAAYRRAGGEA